MLPGPSSHPLGVPQPSIRQSNGENSISRKSLLSRSESACFMVDQPAIEFTIRLRLVEVRFPPVCAHDDGPIILHPNHPWAICERPRGLAVLFIVRHCCSRSQDSKPQLHIPLLDREWHAATFTNYPCYDSCHAVRNGLLEHLMCQ